MDVNNKKRKKCILTLLPPPSRSQVVATRVLIAVAFFIFWHWSQSHISHYKTPIVDSVGLNYQIVDFSLIFFDRVNKFLNEHHFIAGLMIMLDSLLIDITTLFIGFYGLFGKSFKPLLGLMIVMLLRQICQIMIILPMTEGKIWFDPGFPALFVTYKVANDFFFSGHTALVVYSMTQIPTITSHSKKNFYIKGSIVLFQLFCVFATKGHYFMDVFTAIVTAVLVAILIKNIKLPNWLDCADDKATKSTV